VPPADPTNGDLATRFRWSADGNALRGRIALVAGATRGAGRGIAAALGEAGATVICTGRSSVNGPGGSDYDRPETIEDTAELVTSLGGTGIAIGVDHLDPEQVRQLGGRVRDEHGRLDVLVNDIWGTEQLKGGPADWDTPIWQHDLGAGLRILRLGVETHLITSHHLLPLLIGQPGGLLIEVTDGTTAFNASTYRISVFYDLAKVAANRLAFSQGHELAPHGGHRGGHHPRLAALGDDARCLRGHRGDLARRPPAGPGRWIPARPGRLRRLRVTALRRPRRGRPGRRPRPGALEPALGDRRPARPGVRIHRHRRRPARRLGPVRNHLTAFSQMRPSKAPV